MDPPPQGYLHIGFSEKWGFLLFSLTNSSSNHGLLAYPSIPSTHKVLGEPPPAACLRKNRESLLSCGRGGTTKQGSTWGPGLGGFGDMGSGGQDSPVQRRVRASGNFCFSPQSVVGVLETGFLPTLDLPAEVAISSGKDRRALGGRETKQNFAGTQAGGGQFGTGVHCVV